MNSPGGRDTGERPALTEAQRVILRELGPGWERLYGGWDLVSARALVTKGLAKGRRRAVGYPGDGLRVFRITAAGREVLSNA